MRGVLNVCKPAGISSYDVIRRLKPVVGVKTKIGHAGTLDPMATGVLLVLLGEATKVAGLLLGREKTYEAEVLFGTRTDTDDITGAVIETRPVPEVPADELRRALTGFNGQIMQAPPAFSALKQDGRPLYELARRGRPVQTEPRPVTVYQLELLDWTPPRAQLRCTVSSGTYIRSLARDLGPALGTVATLARLVRTRVGQFTIDSAVEPDALRQENIAGRLVPIADALPGMPRTTVEPEAARLLLCGRIVRLPAPAGFSGPGLAVTTDGRFLARVNVDGDRVRAERVIHAD